MATALAPSKVTARDPKGTKFVSIVEASYNKAGLSEEEAQRVNDTPGLSKLIDDFIAENRLTDKYKDEEEESSYGYLSGYDPNPGLKKNLGDLEAELAILRKSFPELANADFDRTFVERIKSGEIKLPKGAERWVLIPRWQLLDSTYSGAFLKILAAIKTARGRLYNYRDGEIDEKHLRQTVKSAEAWEKIGAEQKGEILVVAIQAGITHRGRSVRRAREVFQPEEFGFGAFAVGVIVLTHEERLSNVDDLWMDCAGDEWSPGADGDFSRCPFFRFDGDGVRFGTRDVGLANARYGSVSGRVPQ